MMGQLFKPIFFLIDEAVKNHESRVYPAEGNCYGIQVNFIDREWYWLKDRYQTEEDAMNALLILKLSI